MKLGWLGGLETWYTENESRTLLIALHGFGQRPFTRHDGYLSFASMTDLPARSQFAGVRLLLPDGQRDWRERDHRNIETLIDHARRMFGVDQVFLAGFSDGATHAYEIACRVELAGAVIHSALWRHPGKWSEGAITVSHPWFFVASGEGDRTPTDEQTLDAFRYHYGRGDDAAIEYQYGRHPNGAAHWWSPHTTDRVLSWVQRRSPDGFAL